MQVDHRGVDGLVAEQVFDGQDIQSFFQQMGGVGVPERVHVHRLEYPCFLFGLVDRPLYAPLGIAGVEVAPGAAADLAVGAVEHPDMGLLGFQVGFQTPDQDVGQRDVAVFLAFAILDMEHLSIKVQVGNPEVPDLKTAKSTTIEQPDQYPMLEQAGGFQEPAHFFLAQDNRKLLASLDAGKFDPLVLHALDAVGEAQGIDGELEVRVRRGVVSPLDQMEVVVDPVGVHFGGQFVEVERKLGQVAGVVGQGAFALARHDNFLLKLGQ